jgi:alpha-D-ribose 1-methylphosphonate 5-triphosphate diphosphatase PhnM
LLPVVTSNTACVLKLGDKGELAEGESADVLVLRRGSLEIREVMRITVSGEEAARPRGRSPEGVARRDAKGLKG